jgi:hypothetical protein
MSDLANLLLLLVLVAVVGLWFKLSVARERAVHEARRQCLQHRLQLLDDSVGLRALRLRRVDGLRMIERCYGFDVSVDGADREPGRLWMVGNTLSALTLPTIGLRPGSPAAPSAAHQEASNVVPLRPLARIDNQPH